jgi:2'-5' RNA ligase
LSTPPMGRIAVVGYPVLSEEDRQWIESVRIRHDPRAGRIQAHFTMVFPCHATPSDALASMSAASPSCAPIRFTIGGAEAVSDLTGHGAHVFLIPDDLAGTHIAVLHDRLYRGALRSHLRRDIPFLPHMTVAADGDLEWCQELARRLSERCRSIRGTVDAIELINVDPTPVSTLHRCPLAGSD